MQQPEPVNEYLNKSIEIDLMIRKQKEKVKNITKDKFADADKAFKHMN